MTIIRQIPVSETSQQVSQKELTKVRWNVISEDEFERRIKRVFENVAAVLSNTLGPYGSTTMLEMTGDFKFTKDGYSVLKRFVYDNMMEDSMGSMLLNISQRIVRKVGDGSTTAVLAAKEVYEELLQVSKENRQYRPRVIQKKIVDLSKRISKEIKKISTPINRDGDFSDIYKLALISTNDNHEIAALLQEAYQKVKSTNIRFVHSRTNESSLEIIEGYQSKIRFTSTSYVNSAENNTGTFNNVKVLIFDHMVEYEYHYQYLMEVISNAHATGQRVIIIAPQYDRIMYNEMQNIFERERNTMGNVFTVWTTATMTRNIDRAKLDDLAALLGAKVIQEHIINEFNKRAIPKEERERSFKERLQGNVNDLIVVDFKHYMGEVGSIVIGDKYTLFSGFHNKDEEAFNLCYTVAKAAYEKQLAHDNEFDTPGTEIVPLHDRLMALNLAIATIKVGGNSRAEREATYDLVDDSVKACRAAYEDGYNFGGSLANIYAARIVLGGSNNLDELDKIIINSIIKAFEKVYGYVLANAGIMEPAEVKEIIDTSVHNHKCFNLVTEEYDGDVINPTRTDVEILEAVSSIVSLLITSNQYVAKECVTPL